MTNKFLTTVLVLITATSSVSFAKIKRTHKPQPQQHQQQQYEVEAVETNDIYNDVEAANDIDPSAAGNNESVDSDGSPQINIYNANANSNKQAQKSHAQTDTQSAVESTVVAESDSSSGYIQRANEVRRARKDMEVGTEQKIIEKIEWSRIDDEKDRNDRLFGNRLEKKKYDNNYDNNYENNYESKKEVVVIEKATPVVPYAAPYQAPAPVYKDEVKTDAYSVISDSQSYISPTVGWMSHPSAVNVDPATTFGIAAGMVYSSGIAMEVGLQYANVKMEDYDVRTFNGLPGLKEIDQYSLNSGVKYNFNHIGRIVPNIGALLGYTYRDYNETRAFNRGTTSSSAVDAGLSAGVDVRLTSALSLGIEYRYMKNVWNDRQDSNNSGFAPAGFGQFAAAQSREKLEEVGYQQFNANAKFAF